MGEVSLDSLLSLHLTTSFLIESTHGGAEQRTSGPVMLLSCLMIIIPDPSTFLEIYL